MNPRRLAGSRRNKHLPIARRVHFSDWDARTREFILSDLPLLESFAALSTRPSTPRPDHAARAVDIRTIWPPLTLDDSTAKQRKAAEAGARGKSAAPMSSTVRSLGYIAQNAAKRGTTTLTARQRRQVNRMQYRAGLAAA